MKNRMWEAITTCSAFVLLILLVFSITIITIRIVGINSPIATVNDSFNCTKIIVQSGDTLWSIAQTQVPSEDPRDVVGSIKELNGLKSADIFPGQVLLVAVKHNIQPIQLAEGLSN